MKQILLLSILLLCALSLFAQTPFQTVTASGNTLQYRVTANSQSLECRYTVPTTGWAGVCFGISNGMQDANIIIGFRSGNTSSFRDDFGTSFSTHASDVSLGGVDNLSNATVTETGGTTEFDFMIPLNSGDSFDRQLVIGQTYNIALARGAEGADDFTSHHAALGMTTITIVAPVANGDNSLSPLPQISQLTMAPNPIHSAGTLSFLAKNSFDGNVSIYNVRGELVRLYPQTHYTQGEHRLTWDGTDSHNQFVQNGIYFYRLDTTGKSLSGKVIVLR